MEARVDVRKLQVLNDRINQTIDALNQVRLSVHGLAHTGVPSQINPLTSPMQTPGFQQIPFGFPQTQGLGQQGLGQQALGQQGLGQPQGWGPQGMFPGGLGHTGSVPPQLNPLTYLTQGQGFPTQGFGTQGIFGQQGFQGNPLVGTGYGLQHTPSQPYLNPLVNPTVPSPWGIPSGMGVAGGQQEMLEQKLVEARASDPYRITQTFPFAVI